MSGNMDQNEFSYSYSTAVVTFFQYFNADVVNAQSGEGYPLKKSSRTTFNVVLRVTYCLFTSCWLAHNQLSRNLLSFSCNPSGQLCLSGPGYTSGIVNIFSSVFFFLHMQLTVKRHYHLIDTLIEMRLPWQALYEPSQVIFRAKRETPTQSVRWSSSRALRERPHPPPPGS